MNNIAAKGKNSPYDRSKDNILFGEDKTSKRNIKHHKFAHERRSKK